MALLVSSFKAQVDAKVYMREELGGDRRKVLIVEVL